MAKLQTPEQVQALKASSRGKGKQIVFGEEISKLKSTQGLLIESGEWTLKTTPTSYYYRTLKLKENKSFTINKVPGGFLITKK
jgi:hypothetical protein